MYLSVYLVFIFRKFMQARAETRQWVQTYERLTPNYCCPNSYTLTMTQRLGIGAEASGHFSLITTSKDTDGHDQSTDQIRWTAPNGWATSLPMVTSSSNWRNGGWEKARVYRCEYLYWYMMGGKTHKQSDINFEKKPLGSSTFYLFFKWQSSRFILKR